MHCSNNSAPLLIPTDFQPTNGYFGVEDVALFGGVAYYGSCSDIPVYRCVLIFDRVVIPCWRGVITKKSTTLAVVVSSRAAHVECE